jgi:hypothetical protein
MAAAITRAVLASPLATACELSPLRAHSSRIRERRNTSWSVGRPDTMVNIISEIHGSAGLH